MRKWKVHAKSATVDEWEVNHVEADEAEPSDSGCLLFWRLDAKRRDGDSVLVRAFGEGQWLSLELME